MSPSPISLSSSLAWLSCRLDGSLGRCTYQGHRAHRAQSISCLYNRKYGHYVALSLPVMFLQKVSAGASVENMKHFSILE